MKVVISTIFAINPSVIRVELYTYDDTTGVADYALAVPVELFTSRNDETHEVEVDVAKFQQIVSERIIEARNVATLAKYVENQQLEWDLVVEPKTEEQKEESPLDGMNLAYGEKS